MSLVEPGARVDRSTVSEPRRRELEAALRRAIRGEVSFDGGTRAVFATDSSDYRQVPLGVVFPWDRDDGVAALRLCAEHDAPVLARGAGTWQQQLVARRTASVRGVEAPKGSDRIPFSAV